MLLAAAGAAGQPGRISQTEDSGFEAGDGMLAGPLRKEHAEAIQRCAAWVAKARPTEDGDPEWLALRLLLAKAYLAYAGENRGADAKQARTAGQASNEARRLAQAVAKFPSEYQSEAQELVAQLGGPVRNATKAEDPRTFVEAKDAGREILDAMDGAKLVVERVPERIAKEQDAGVKAELQAQLDAARQTLSTGPQEAQDYFQLALQLADADTPAEDLNVVRYFLAYVYYEESRLYEAAVLGEFIARRQPDSSPAREAAQIALVCYLRLHAEAEGTRQVLRNPTRDFPRRVHRGSVAGFARGSRSNPTHDPAAHQWERLRPGRGPARPDSGQLAAARVGRPHARPFAVEQVSARPAPAAAGAAGETRRR